MATPAQWIEGARLRTLPMALAPVVAGSAAAQALHSFDPVRALLALCDSLELTVVATGIETEGQRAWLTGEGCRFAQGFGLHLPLEAEAVDGLLARAG